MRVSGLYGNQARKERKTLLFDGMQRPHTGPGGAAVVGYAHFRRNFHALTRGLFEKVNWDNMIVAGGSVLACLTHRNLHVCI